MVFAKEIYINETKIALDAPTYFIADIAANHDGDLQRAKDLIYLAKESGANCAKFQHFEAGKIVSDFGFKSLKTAQSHQSTWEKSVFEIYQNYECKREWTDELVKTAKDAHIDFMTTPYDVEAVELVDKYMPAYKIGSGDITWIEFLEYVARKNKPILLATGASSMEDVDRAMNAISKHSKDIILMQCNTNYTADIENYKYLNLNVLKTYAQKYPGVILGLSDHSFGHAAVLGAIALGARVIEKHFTDDNNRIGPDHHFAMNPKTWRDMVDRSRELELALGDGIKRVEGNEKDTVVIQRRCLRLTRDVKSGETLTKKDLTALRPAPENSVLPYDIEKIIGKQINKDKKSGDFILFEEFE